MQDIEYKNFHSKLMPTIDDERIIGIRVPALRKFAKTLFKQDIKNSFMNNLPHYYYEENNIHAFLIERIDDFDEALEETNKFLPYIDNWATCDMFSPKIFKKEPALIYEKVKQWLKSDETFIVRFGIVTLLQFYLDELFQEEMLSLVSNVKREEYYIKMAVAWYFSIALVKQYDKTISYFTTQQLENWTHNKAIQKAIESRRISEERKVYLRSLKVKK